MHDRPIHRSKSRNRSWRQIRPHRFDTRMNLPIKFGTDGWRGIIADTFTFENVEHVAQASAGYFNTVTGKERSIFIGFDGRFQSQTFARKTAEVLAGNGLRVVMMDR